jgi:hypothetical protein
MSIGYITKEDEVKQGVAFRVPGSGTRPVYELRQVR